MYSTKDLELINHIKIGSYGPFYISSNGNIYNIDHYAINEINLEKSSDNIIKHYVSWNPFESRSSLISDFNEKKIEQLIVFENDKKLFIFKRKDKNDNYYVSFF